MEKYLEGNGSKPEWGDLTWGEKVGGEGKRIGDEGLASVEKPAPQKKQWE